MSWITGSEGDSIHSGSSAVTGPSGGTIIRSLQLWDQVPWIRARMAGGELCPACMAVTEEHQVPV